MDKQEILLKILREIIENGLEERVYNELHPMVMQTISTIRFELGDYRNTVKTIRKINNKKNMAIENLSESCELLGKSRYYIKGEI